MSVLSQKEGDLLTALINKIDPNKHPKTYWSILILTKWVLPNMVIICILILIMLIGLLFVDSLEALNDMELTEAEEALKNLVVSGVALMGILYLMGRRH